MYTKNISVIRKKVMNEIDMDSYWNNHPLAPYNYEEQEDEQEETEPEEDKE